MQVFKDMEQWAEDRGFFDADATSQGQQFIKLTEELGEMAKHMARRQPIQDDIGDMIQVLTILARLNGWTLEECANAAYNDIKNRKGRMINGIFVKQADLVKMNVPLDKTTG